MKIKNTILIVVAVIAMIVIYAFANPIAETDKGIKFHKGTWAEALQIAKKENKLIFLDIYATWCGPCKKLKARTFSNKEVGSFYNNNFINVALDGELKEGEMLMQKHALRSFPSLLFIDGNGKVVGQTAGYHSPSELIQLGQNFSKK